MRTKDWFERGQRGGRPRRARGRAMGLALVTLIGLGALAASGCSSYVVKSRSYTADVDYAKPQPGKFRVVKRNLTVTTFWDSETSKAEEGSEAYLEEMTSLMVRAMAQLVSKAQLGPNQALYNVRISAPGVAAIRYSVRAVLAFATAPGVETAEEALLGAVGSVTAAAHFLTFVFSSMLRRK